MGQISLNDKILIEDLRIEKMELDEIVKRISV